MLSVTAFDPFLHDADYSIDYYLCYRKLHERVILELVEGILSDR